MYTLDENYVVNDGTWRSFGYNEDVGYVYTSFTYPGSLVSSIGDNVCTILDKIKNTLGNYEYFYDVEGNFVFQEVKNYLNTSYDPTDVYRLDNGRKVELLKNGLCIIVIICLFTKSINNIPLLFSFILFSVLFSFS